VTTVIIKPTDGCNARCLYCSAAHPGAAKRMSPTVLDEVYRLFGDWALRAGRRKLGFIWHGGEPLLMPAEFWDRALSAQTRDLVSRGIEVENRIQTNLTCLTSKHLPILRRLLGEHGTVGTSFDPLPGIRELKGASDGLYRARWESAVRRLVAEGIRYGIVCVVHSRSLPRLAELYRMLRAEHPNAGIRFNPLYRQGRAIAGGVWNALGISADEWGDALTVLHEEWTRDGRPRSILPFGPWWDWHAEGHWRLSCECSGNCAGGHFGVDPDGGIYNCGRTADGGSFRFGTAGELTAAALGAHPLRRSFANRMVYLERTACRDCPYWSYCHGGCLNDAVLEHGTPFAPTSFCRGLKSFFERAYGSPRRGSARRECGECAA
jgi:uncharacterized protein